MSMSSSTTTLTNPTNPPPPAQGPSQHASHAHHSHHVHHARTGHRRRTASTTSHPAHHAGLHRTRSHASTSNLMGDASAGGHAMGRTASHGGVPSSSAATTSTVATAGGATATVRPSALAPLKGMTSAPGMARQASKSGSEDGGGGGAKGGSKMRRKSLAAHHVHHAHGHIGRSEMAKRSQSSGMISKIPQVRSDTSLHRSTTEPPRRQSTTTTDAADAADDAVDDEWESGDDDTDEEVDEEGEEDGALELKVKKRPAGASRHGRPRGDSKERVKDRATVAPPPQISQAMSRTGSRQSQGGHGHGPDGGTLHRVPTIGFEVAGELKKNVEAEAEPAVEAPATPQDATANVTSPSARSARSVGTELGEPSLEKAERKGFIMSPPSPEKRKMEGKRDDEQSHSQPSSSSPRPQEPRPQLPSSSASSRPHTAQPNLRTRTSLTSLLSLRSLQSMRAPPHPLNSPGGSSGRRRASNAKSAVAAGPVVNTESAKAVWSGGDMRGGGRVPEEESSTTERSRTLSQPQASGQGNGRQRADEQGRRQYQVEAGGPSGGSSDRGRKGTTSSIGGEGLGATARVGGGLSAHEAAKAAARLANQSGYGGGGSTRPGSYHSAGSVASGATSMSASGSGNFGIGGGGAGGQSGWSRNEWDQSHLVSRFLADSQVDRDRNRNRRRRQGTTPRITTATTTDDENESAKRPARPAFPESPFAKSHASLVMGMREAKLRGGPAPAGQVVGLSPFELSMQRVLAQRAVAVTTSGLAGLGIQG